jgi:TolB protein
MILKLNIRKISKFTLYLLIFNLLIFQSTFAQQEIWAKITSGATSARKVNVAIADFLLPPNCPIALSDVAKTVKQVTIDDLQFSLFLEITKLDSTKNFSVMEKKIDYANWMTTGAQVLIVGEIQIKQNNMLKINIYDLFTRRLIGTKNYGLDNELRWLAHRLADNIIKLLTGEDGISQTRIAFSLKKDRAKELTVIDYDGYNLTQLTSAGELKLFPDWTPNNKKIAY